MWLGLLLHFGFCFYRFANSINAITWWTEHPTDLCYGATKPLCCVGFYKILDCVSIHVWVMMVCQLFLKCNYLVNIPLTTVTPPCQLLLLLRITICTNSTAIALAFAIASTHCMQHWSILLVVSNLHKLVISKNCYKLYNMHAAVCAFWNTIVAEYTKSVLCWQYCL